jgi:hypothetical protein
MTTVSMPALGQSAPRSSTEVKRQLDDLARVKHEAQAHGIRDFATQSAWNSILAQEESLTRELAAAREWESRRSPCTKPGLLKKPA